MKHRTYTEEEMAALLERAAELQAQSSSNAADTGLTLDELEAVAAETGLDPSFLRQAASEMDTPRPVVRANTGTTATHVFVERWVEGGLTEEAWEDVVVELRHRFDTDLGKLMGMPQQGVSATEQIGRMVEWKHTSLSGVETRVLVRPRGERLHVRLSQRVGWGSSMAESVGYGATIAGVLASVVGVIAESAPIGAAVLMLTLAMAIPLIYYADQAWRKRKHADLEVLADEVCLLLTVPAQAPQAGAVHVVQEEPDTEPEVDVPWIDVVEEPDQEPTRTSDRSRARRRS